ncbi:hypothetical protein E4U21_004610 [Claviceps maximensis]|nr:hypothetical protein E4U21_004610 [Claviceps maximensis]
MEHSVGSNYQSSRIPASAPRIAGSERLPSKLRETCRACALSKVRCSKEKPSCARCSKRGVTCEYIVTKRPGRKRDPTKSSLLGGTVCNELDVTSAGPNATNSNCLWIEDMLPDVAGGNGRLGTTGNEYLDSTRVDANSPILWPLTANEGTDLVGDMSDFLMPLITPLSSTFTVKTPDFLNTEVHVSAPSTPSNDQPMQNGSSVVQLLIPDSVGEGHASAAAAAAAEESLSLDFFSASSSRSLSSVPASTPSSRIADDSDSSAMSSCCCLMKALEMMSRLCSSDLVDLDVSRTGRINAVQDETLSGHVHGSPLLNATFTANKQTIEALSTMLHGSCQENVYLLTCMSMIVFKVLRRYEVAAGQSMSAAVHDAGDFPHENEARQRHVNQDGDSLRRVAAQLVLGELHLVKQLVNRLSFRLRNSVDRAFDDGSNSETSDSMLEYRAASFEDKEDTSFFSGATLSQMDHDLRKGLLMLSSNIINMLRRI